MSLWETSPRDSLCLRRAALPQIDGLLLAFNDPVVDYVANLPGGPHPKLWEGWRIHF